MKSKIENPFNVRLTHEQQMGLGQFDDDHHVRRIILLPSFKLKNTNLSGIRVTRCDDVVLRTKKAHPAYCEYQIGCGFLVVELDVIWHEKMVEPLKMALQLAMAELPQLSFPKPRRLAQKLLGFDIPERTKLPESIQPTKWLATIFSGVGGYLRETGDPCNFFPHMAGFTHGSVDLTSRHDEVGGLLSARWRKGRALWPNDNTLLTLTGSHYIDIHFIRDSMGKEFQESLGRLVLHVHACGSNFSALLNPAALALAQHGGLNERDFMTLTELMHNFAAINRVAVAVRFIRHLRSLIGPFSAAPIIDQSHHDITNAPGGEFLYFNDSQRMSTNRIAILPAGHPLVDSLLVTPGVGAERVMHGLSHNLKIPVKTGGTVPSGRGYVSLVEAYQKTNGGGLFSLKPAIDVLEKKHQHAPGMAAMIKRMRREEIIQPLAVLQPLLRYHFRRLHEKPWERIGLS